MTKVVQEAIAVLRELPEDQQATVARAILNYAEHADEIYVLSDEFREAAGRNE